MIKSLTWHLSFTNNLDSISSFCSLPSQELPMLSLLIVSSQWIEIDNCQNCLFDYSKTNSSRGKYLMDPFQKKICHCQYITTSLRMKMRIKLLACPLFWLQVAGWNSRVFHSACNLCYQAGQLRSARRNMPAGDQPYRQRWNTREFWASNRNQHGYATQGVNISSKVYH